MRTLLFSCFAALVLTGCNEGKEENRRPPPKRELVTYNIIIPYSFSNTADSTSALSIKTTQCKPLYYDEQLIRVICFRDGDWIWSKGDWTYKGKDIVFDGVVKAYYQPD